MSMNFERIFPHASMPGITSVLYEPIDYKKALGKVTNYGEPGVDVIYKILVDAISANTTVGDPSVWRNDRVKNDGSFRQMAVPYYKVESAFTMTSDEIAKFNKLNLGMSLEEFKRMITIQAMNQRRAHMTFFGADVTEKQGLFYASSETVALPQDSASNDKLSAYVPGELLEFLVSQVRELSNKSFNMLRPIVIVAPINAINYLKSKIVPLTNYQEKGAGTSSVAKVFESVVYDMNGTKVEFVPCSYMAGKGTSNKDVMLLIAPGMEVKAEDMDSTAYFNNLKPEDYVNTFLDNALELQETQNPVINQVYEYFFQSIFTPGFCTRADSIRTIEYQYA